MPPQSSTSTNWRRPKREEERPKQDRPDAAREQRSQAASNRVYVGNMPYTAQRQDVQKLFKDEGFKIANIDISTDPFTSLNPSYCFVDLVNSNDAQAVGRKFPGKMFCGRPLKVNSTVQKRSPNLGPQSSRLESTRWKSEPQRPGALPPPSPTADFLIPIQEKRRLFVGGLPKPTDNHSSDLEIRNLFKGFDVEAVSKVKSPKVGQLPGNAWYAFVDLKTAGDAQRAIRQLDGMQMWGSSITVNLAGGFPTKVLNTITKEEEDDERRGWRVAVSNHDATT